MTTCRQCQRDIEPGALACGACGAPVLADPGRREVLDPFVGQTLEGTYFIQQKIGDGGMGQVYQALHLETNQPVAIKILKRDLLGDRVTLERFKREARAVLSLRHPNIVSAMDFGVTEDGTVFLAMELVAGRTLARIMAEDSPLPERRIVQIGAQILAGLAEAHAHQLLHRDLKPANVMVVSSRDEPDAAKILDFGIAKSLLGEGQSTLTQTGVVCGTPAYMSPEQWSGQGLEPRSDLYSVGVILYEMVTGFVPYRVQTPMEIVHKHLTEKPLPPSERRPDRTVSPDLERLIMRALSVDPEQRPASATKMREELLAGVLLFERMSEQDTISRTAPLPPAPAKTLRTGGTVQLGQKGGRYEIVRPLGQGGMAEVFLARRLGAEGFVREVAIKRVFADAGAVDDPEHGVVLRQALIDEARVASQLHHPNIAEAIDLELVGDGYYFILEYVEGVSLKEVLKAASRNQKHLSENFCSYVVAGVAEALHYAHNAKDDEGRPLGIVHRDIKPSNVMIGVAGQVKLLDFGVAFSRLKGRERTRTGMTKGTVCYSSPEQASGQAIDGRSDLFSLTIVFLELLTGEHVFNDRHEGGILAKIIECRASEVRLATRPLSPTLQEICQKGLAKNPAERFRDGAEYAEALRRFLIQKGEIYGARECTRELRAMGVFTGALTERTKIRVVEKTELMPVSRAGTGSKRGRLRSLGMAAAVMGIGILVVLGVVNKGKKGEPTLTRPVVPLIDLDGSKEMTREETVAPSLGNPGTDSKSEPARGQNRRTAVGSSKEGLYQITNPGTVIQFKDRPSVARASGTIDRGTLIHAELLVDVDVTTRGFVSAVVTRDVAGSGGGVLIAKGSQVSCAVNAVRGDRAIVSCDRVQVNGRVLAFSAIVVGADQRAGIPLTDTGAQAGTSFVIYVNAPAR